MNVGAIIVLIEVGLVNYRPNDINSERQEKAARVWEVTGVKGKSWNTEEMQAGQDLGGRESSLQFFPDKYLQLDWIIWGIWAFSHSLQMQKNAKKKKKSLCISPSLFSCSSTLLSHTRLTLLYHLSLLLSFLRADEFSKPAPSCHQQEATCEQTPRPQPLRAADRQPASSASPHRC